ncbi:MAG: ATP-binding protein [Thalassobaculales bacterium]
MIGLLKAMMPRSLFGRSLLIIVMPLILLQVVTTYVFYDRHWETLSRRLAGSLAGDIAFLVEALDRVREAGGSGLGVFDMAERHLDLRVAFQPGAILPAGPLYDPADEVNDIIERALEERVRRPFQIDGDSLEREVLVRVQLADGVLEVVTTRKRLFSSTTYVFILWMVGTSMVLFAVAVMFMRNQIRPIQRLAAAAESFGKGREGASFRPAGASEVRQAAQAFLLMQDRIRRQIRQRTEMLAGVSHDLRTALTRMKLQLALMGDGADIEGLRRDVGEMETMVEGYLAFVRGDGSEQTVETDLPTLLAEVVDGQRHAGKKITLDAAPLALPLRPLAFKRSLANLVANAARYGSAVAVTARRDGPQVEILVDDDGPGIPEPEREAVFRPFYRLDRSRNPTTGGVGLGLAIARDIVRAHGGDILLDASPLGGLRARVKVPL